MIFNDDEFSYKNIPLTKIRELVLEDQMRIAVDLRNKNFISLQKRIYTFFRSENSRVFAVYQAISESGLFFFNHLNLVEDIVSKLWFIVKNPNFYKAVIVKEKLYKNHKRIMKSTNVIDSSLQFLYKMVLQVIFEEISDPNNFSSKSFRSPNWAVKAVSLVFEDVKINDFKKYVLKLDLSKFLMLDSLIYNWILNNLSIYTFFNFDLILIPRNIVSQWRAKRFYYL